MIRSPNFFIKLPLNIFSQFLSPFSHTVQSKVSPIAFLSFLPSIAFFLSSVFPEALTVVHKDPREQRKTHWNSLYLNNRHTHLHHHRHIETYVHKQTHTGTQLPSSSSLTRLLIWVHKEGQLSLLLWYVCMQFVCVREKYREGKKKKTENKVSGRQLQTSKSKEQIWIVCLC